jgi:hypothetical protein
MSGACSINGEKINACMLNLGVTVMSICDVYISA